MFVIVGCGDAVGINVAVRVGIWVAVETKVWVGVGEAVEVEMRMVAVAPGGGVSVGMLGTHNNCPT